jgi:hypothetical protein
VPPRLAVGIMGFGALRFPVKERRNDHSDSNWTASNSEVKGT